MHDNSAKPCRNMYRTAPRLRVIAALLGCVMLATVAGVARADETGPDKGDGKSIAMIGAGNMGQALGPLWAAAGYRVIFATRNPDELDALVERAGHGASAASVADAIAKADIVVLAVPYGAEPSIANAHADAMKGKVLVNMDNAFVRRDGDVARKAEAMGEALYSASLFPGTRFIRAFNLVSATRFPEPGRAQESAIDVPYTTNDESVRPTAEALIKAAGGKPIYEGSLENAREY